MLKNIAYYPGEASFARGFGIAMAVSDLAVSGQVSYSLIFISPSNPFLTLSLFLILGANFVYVVSI
jgi:hypothetical protein